MRKIYFHFPRNSSCIFERNAKYRIAENRGNLKVKSRHWTPTGKKNFANTHRRVAFIYNVFHTVTPLPPCFAVKPQHLARCIYSEPL